MSGHVHEWLEQQLDYAEKNKLCVTAQSALDLKRLHRAVVSGPLVETAPKTFARTSYWNKLKPANRMLHLMRSLQKLHPDWIFAGPSAAVAYGFAVSNRYLDNPWIATTRKTHRRVTKTLHPILVKSEHVTTIDGLRLTPLGRTVGDCLRIMDFRSGLAVADSVLHARQMTRDQLTASINSACNRMPGITRIRSVVGLADANAESGGESIARATMLELGIALPSLQRQFANPLKPNEPYRVDFAWEIAGRFILAELDGHEKYVNNDMTRGKSITQIIDDEHLRQTHIEADPCVLRMIRFGFSTVMHEQEFLQILISCGVPRTYALDRDVCEAGGVLRCR